ncbi:MAG: cation:proton antiporter [Verrucomicrobiota bacterium]|nr:cation:proton antiporter [Limisphaera sp.]MDW8382265.1 cation:proton antiporter [Verrucomicrobiota bacterium]
MELIRDLAVVWLVAGVVAWLCTRLRLSVVVGYLVAGMVIGPHTPPFALVRDQARVSLLAELGLVFLVFGIGLNLSLRRVQALGWSVVVATSGAALLILQASRLMGWALGLDAVGAMFLASVLMVSSSAVISKVLQETQQTHDRPGQLALGMTLLEDLVAVVMLTVLTSLVRMDDGATGVGRVLGGMIGFVVLVVLLTLLVAPKLLAGLARQGVVEIRTLVVAGTLLGLSWIAVQAGYSAALGAFLFGMIVGGTRYRAEVARAFQGIQHAFGALFFVAIGMQVNVWQSLSTWPAALGLAALAWVLRPCAAAAALLAIGTKPREALHAGLLLTPLGEFSFVLARLGVDAGVMPEAFYGAVVGAAVLTALTASWITRGSESWSWRLMEYPGVGAIEWLGFYSHWWARLRARMGGRVVWRLVRRPLMQVLGWTAVLSALLLTAPQLWRVARDWVGRGQPVAGGWAWLFTALLVSLALPIAVALWRSLGVVSLLLAEAATSSATRGRLRNLLEGLLRGLGAAGILIWLSLWLPPGWSLVGGAGMTVVCLVLAAVLFRRSLIRWQTRLEWELRREFGSGKVPGRGVPLAAVADSGVWPLDVMEVELPGDTLHAGRSLAELRLRERFGCTVVGVERQGWPILNPDGACRLFPYDRLLVLGEPKALRKGLGYLCASQSGDRSAGFEELVLETVWVPDQCGWAGRTLGELELVRRFGIQVVGIRRGGNWRGVPSGGERLSPGDELLVLGTHERIGEFVTQLNRGE